MLARGAPGRALGYFETTLKQGWGAGVRIITAQNFLAASGYPHKCQTSYCALWGTFWARIRGCFCGRVQFGRALFHDEWSQRSTFGSRQGPWCSTKLFHPNATVGNACGSAPKTHPQKTNERKCFPVSHQISTRVTCAHSRGYSSLPTCTI